MSVIYYVTGFSNLVSVFPENTDMLLKTTLENENKYRNTSFPRAYNQNLNFFARIFPLEAYTNVPGSFGFDFNIDSASIINSNIQHSKSNCETHPI